ncbi:MAG: acyl-CoA dehydrogenase family protein [Alphaproteobacteria bacterium]|jgi:acyl-CoA dehydrogenase|nr:acyl-CoA dehydrogenase [Rhodospirillaceae bacterium]MDP6404612.1 acyl-CoA dehydrogenase family protein [Alphaproteobacteria bacterium]MDP6621381.1 acyl-CoA dehydrogenase family protein [Alphaproteobacteria bacterium]|tara:strand:- start:214 stop:1353 length:1140 start_codon:yes stop_codon:yes gene_type:complete
MTFVLNEEQVLIKDTAHNFFADQAPVSALRALRDEGDEQGYSPTLWRDMAELGFAGILVAEEHGGSGLGYLPMGLVLEESGRTLAATPLLATAVIGAAALQLAGSAEQQSELLPSLAGGETLLALAHEEGPHHAPRFVATRAGAVNGGFRISGEKSFVLDGHIADQLIVVARTAGEPSDYEGLTLFLVPAHAAGVTRTRTMMVDSRNAARIAFDDVHVGPEAVLGEVGGGARLLDDLLDRARIALSAEMLGSVLEAFERSVEYLKVREQFGVPIGSFQALKHRAALMFNEIELSKSIVLEGLSALDVGRDDVALLASCAKAKLCDAFELVSSEAVQLHGGIGMTDEEEIGFFLKRARVAQRAFGDAAFHRDRFARLQEF